jgi:hypothetical protein
MNYEAVIPFSTFYRDKLVPSDSNRIFNFQIKINPVPGSNNGSGNSEGSRGGGMRGGGMGGGGGMRGGGMGGGGGMRGGGMGVAAVCAVAEWVAEEMAIREILIWQEQQRQQYN